MGFNSGFKGLSKYWTCCYRIWRSCDCTSC